jgi:predicted permease
MFDRFFLDLRFAFRQLIRRPGFSALLLLTVAVAIGANVAIFSVLEGIVLRPLPYPEAEKILAVWETPEGESRWYQPFSGPDYLDVREETRTMEEFGVINLRYLNLAGEGEPVRLGAGAVTASLFDLLGMQPAQGRTFTEEEEFDGNHRVAVLSHGLWQSQFGGQEGVVGRRVSVDGEPFEIIGIMPPDFRAPTPWGGRDLTRLWIPLVLPRDGSRRGSHWLGAYGRMADDVTPDAVEAELAVIAERLSEAYPNTNAMTRMWVQPMMARTLGGISSVLLYLLVTVGLVLLIACANVASMLLARGMNRSSELAIRASMGAGRRGLVRQLLTESLVLSVIGGAVGVLLAYWGVDALKAVMPESIPRVTSIEVDRTVLGFAAGITVFTGILVGLAPSFFASRANLSEVIKHGRASRGGGAGRNRLLSGLVMAQLAIGFVMVNAAMVLAASYENVLHQPMNFATDEVLVTEVSLGGPAYEEPHTRRAFWEELVQRARGFPGVVQAGITSKLPLQGGTNGGVLVRDMVFDPSVQDYLVEHSFVSDGYLEAMGIPLLAGRTLSQQDMEAAAVYAGLDSGMASLPIIINRTMAQELWPDGDAMGELVRPYDSEPYYMAEVVGIVEDVRQWGPEQDPLPEMYFPHTAEVWGPIWGRLIVRTAGDPSTLAGGIQAAVREIDAGIPTATPLTMGKILRNVTAGRRFSMLLVVLFAATALLLIVAGTYGVLSYGVSQRTHEIGVRMTLGANKGKVTALFLTRVGLFLLIGLGTGLFGAWATSALTRSMVFGVSPLNLMHMAGAAGVMILVAMAATLIPVLRATGVDPLEALRAD